MNMYDTSEKLREEFKGIFKDGMSPRQIWWVVKMTKAARLYCRSNVAFNNFMNSVFDGIAKFEQVEKENKEGNKYMGLSIRVLKSDGTSSEEIVGGPEED